MNPIHFFFITALTLGIGCTNGNIAGEWEGDVDCGENVTDVEFDLEREDDDTYAGKGSMDTLCEYTDGSDTWIDDCTIDFDVEVTTEGKAGEQDVDFELDNCDVDGESIDCPDDSELTFDGEDTMEGEEDDCDFEFERS
jgi:hypothetical protein